MSVCRLNVSGSWKLLHAMLLYALKSGCIPLSGLLHWADCMVTQANIHSKPVYRLYYKLQACIPRRICLYKHVSTAVELELLKRAFETLFYFCQMCFSICKHKTSVLFRVLYLCSLKQMFFEGRHLTYNEECVTH